MIYIFLCCIVVEILNLYYQMRLMQKIHLFSMQIGIPQANALKSIGYTDTILFLTIGRPDIYQHKSLGKSATVFIRVTKSYRNWPPTYLIFSAKISGLPLAGDCTFTTLPIVGKSTISVYPTDLRCIGKRHSYLHRK
jgi:hypothetical protein